MAKLQGKVKPEMLDSVFNKAAGTDAKLDQAEFQTMISEVLKKAGLDAAMPPAPAAPAAAPAAAVAAPAAAADAAAAPAAVTAQ
jgi:ribosomal protein L12E/L44/L45/RPP1/RPP2